ncbi:MAG: VTT domain-containing protein [Candidatus Freyarchaeota archaeon]
MHLLLLLVTLSVFDGINAFFQALFNGIMLWIFTYGSFGLFAAMLLQAVVAPVPSEFILMLGGAAFSLQYYVTLFIPLMLSAPEVYNFFTLIFFPSVFPIFTFDYGIFLAGLVGGTGEVVGGVIGFYIARFVGRPVIERWENKAIAIEKEEHVSNGGRIRRTFDKVVIYILGDAVLIADRWITRYGFWAILVTRLTPLIPFDFISYGVGLTKVKFRTFIIPTVIGGYPRAFMYCFFGAKLLLYLNYATFGNPYTLFFIIVAMVVALLAVIYEFVIKRRYLAPREGTTKK